MMAISIDELAQLLHESDRENHDSNPRINTCTYRVKDKHNHVIVCDGGGLWDVMHDGAQYRRKGEFCPRCNGTSVEPFHSWTELTSAERLKLITRATFLLNTLLIYRREFEPIAELERLTAKIDAIRSIEWTKVVHITETQYANMDRGACVIHKEIERILDGDDINEPTTKISTKHV